MRSVKYLEAHPCSPISVTSTYRYGCPSTYFQSQIDEVVPSGCSHPKHQRKISMCYFLSLWGTRDPSLTSFSVLCPLFFFFVNLLIFTLTTHSLISCWIGSQAARLAVVRFGELCLRDQREGPPDFRGRQPHEARDSLPFFPWMNQPNI